MSSQEAAWRKHANLTNGLRAFSVLMLIVAYLFFWDAFFDLGRLAEIFQAPFVFVVDALNYLFQWLKIDVPPTLGFGLVTASLYIALAFGHLKAGVGWKAIAVTFSHLLLIPVWFVGLAVLNAYQPWTLPWALLASIAFYAVYLPAQRPRWSTFKTPDNVVWRVAVAWFYVALFSITFFAIFFASMIESATRYSNLFGCAGKANDFQAAMDCASIGMQRADVAVISMGAMLPSWLLGTLFVLTHKMRIWVLIARHAITYAISGAIALLSMWLSS